MSQLGSEIQDTLGTASVGKSSSNVSSSETARNQATKGNKGKFSPLSWLSKKLSSKKSATDPMKQALISNGNPNDIPEAPGVKDDINTVLTHPSSQDKFLPPSPSPFNGSSVSRAGSEPPTREGSAIGETETESGFSSARSSLYLSTKSLIQEPPVTPLSSSPTPQELQSENEDNTTIQNPFTDDKSTIEQEQTIGDKVKYWNSLIFFAITGIDLRPKPKLTAEEEAKEFSLPLKIFSYVTSVVVAIASGMITAVAVAALHIPTALILLIGLAGYRVNLLVYKSAVDYLLGCFRDFGHGLIVGYEGTYNQNLTKNLIKRVGLAVWDGLKQGFTKGFFQDPSSPTGEMSRTKKILTGIGIFLSFAGGGSLAAMTFTSATSALVHIFAVIGFASLGAFPPALAGAMAIIAFVAMAALMYKSIHIAIKENAHIKLLEFIKDLKHSNEARTTSEIVKHYVISCCKLLFIAAGVALAVIATVATLGAWQHSMVSILTSIPNAYVKACEIASYILVFGLTAAGRIPMVIDKAASVFSSMGGWVGNSLYTIGEKTAKLFGYKPQYQQLSDDKKVSQKTLWDSIKGECLDSQTNTFSVRNTLIFAGKTTAQVLAIGLVVGIVVGSILLNAGGNGAVADEGASFLTKILNFFHIYPSTDMQSGMPFFTGGMVSLILGLDGARTTYLPPEKENASLPKDIEMKDMAQISQIGSSQKTLAALTTPQDAPSASPTTAPQKQAPTKVKFETITIPTASQVTGVTSAAKFDNPKSAQTAKVQDKKRSKGGSSFLPWLRTLWNPEGATVTKIENEKLLPNPSTPNLSIQTH